MFSGIPHSLETMLRTPAIKLSNPTRTWFKAASRPRSSRTSASPGIAIWALWSVVVMSCIPLRNHMSNIWNKATYWCNGAYGISDIWSRDGASVDGADRRYRSVGSIQGLHEGWNQWGDRVRIRNSTGDKWVWTSSLTIRNDPENEVCICSPISGRIEVVLLWRLLMAPMISALSDWRFSVSTGWAETAKALTARNETKNLEANMSTGETTLAEAWGCEQGSDATWAGLHLDKTGTTPFYMCKCIYFCLWNYTETWFLKKRKQVLAWRNDPWTTTSQFYTDFTVKLVGCAFNNTFQWMGGMKIAAENTSFPSINTSETRHVGFSNEIHTHNASSITGF